MTATEQIEYIDELEPCEYLAFHKLDYVMGYVIGSYSSDKSSLNDQRLHGLVRKYRLSFIGE